jgi:ribosome-associated protein
MNEKEKSMPSSFQSRTQKKREAKSVEMLAKALSDLSRHEVEHIPVDPEIREEIFKVQSMSSHGARRRQIKLLSKRLRRMDLSSILQFMEENKGMAIAENQSLQKLERFRNLIVEEEEDHSALDEAAQLFPDLDIGVVASLAQHYRFTGNRRYFREIFKMLKAAHERQEFKRKQIINEGGSAK